MRLPTGSFGTNISLCAVHSSTPTRLIDCVFHLQQVNGDGLSLPFSAELDNLKAEILREIRTEIQKAKQEILDGE